MTKSKKTAPLDYREGGEPKPPEGEELEMKDAAKPSHSRKRSAKGSSCPCGKRPKGKCNCGKADAGMCGMKKRSDALTAPEYLAACELGIQDRSRTYIRARLDAMEVRNDLKCGKGAISQGEKCRKGPATKAQGPSAGVRVGQAAKGVGLGVLEAGKWVSGYNIGKTMASGVTQGKNEKGSVGSKVAAVVGSAAIFGLAGGVGAARRVGAFGQTDLQQHEKNQKKEKAWRRSVGYRDGGTYAKGFKIDFEQLAI